LGGIIGVFVQVANEVRGVFPISIGQSRFHTVSIRPLRRFVEVMGNE
jgi:hydroxymethylglutaryl-CoA reductase